MSVSQLGRFLESGEYKECLEFGLSLLAEGRHDEAEAARIHAALCRSRLELTDYFAAVESGDAAVTQAAAANELDLLGFALVDYATALGAIRRYAESVDSFERFFQGLDTYTAAQCMEGIARQRLAATLIRAGRISEAIQHLGEAHRWFQRFGDEASALDCGRTLFRIHLDAGSLQQAFPFLRDSERYLQAHPADRTSLANHLLDRAHYSLALGEHAESVAASFTALSAADDRLDQQCRAHLLLCHSALAQGKAVDALNFAMAARVCAIDGRQYDLEFEASEILFRLLHERGTGLLDELEGEYWAAGVDLYHYVSERTIRRMNAENSHR